MAGELELADIQGMIMSGYGHLGFAKYLFLQFTDAQKGKAWLKALAPQISTGERWPTDASGKTIKPDYALTLGINYSGLQALGLPEATLESFPEDFRDGIATERRSLILGDRGQSAPEHWSVGKDQSTLHVMLVILAVDPNVLQNIYDRQKTAWESHSLTLIAEETGNLLPHNREHFGFLDGVAQPNMVNGPRNPHASEPEIAPGEFVIGYKNQYDILPIAPKLNDKDLGKNGSYIVFRKLYQDVAGFWNFIAGQAEHENDQLLAEMSASEREVWIASKMVGRWPSGAPLAKYPDKDQPDMPRSEMNNFLYHQRDYDGFKCPRGSHIRRANPRDTNGSDPHGSLATSNSHLIIRRGMSYGSPLIELNNLPPQNLVDDGEDRGLIFLAINASITRQFEFAQQTWINNTKFDRLYNDKDPIVGDHCDKDVPDEKRYDMTIEREPVRRRITEMIRFVIVRGGGYFFMPGISRITMIAEA